MSHARQGVEVYAATQPRTVATGRLSTAGRLSYFVIFVPFVADFVRHKEHKGHREEKGFTATFDLANGYAKIGPRRLAIRTVKTSEVRAEL